VLAYPLGFVLPFLAVPLLRWAALAWAGMLLVPIGIVRAQELPGWRAIVICAVAVALAGAATLKIYGG
jgi:hypothetical protein